MDLNQMTTTQEAIMSAQSLAVSHHHQSRYCSSLVYIIRRARWFRYVFSKMNVDIEALKQGAEI